jgi:hypothetical protein
MASDITFRSFIMIELSMRDKKRRDIAKTYAMLLCEAPSPSPDEFAAINRAIIERWSWSGLEYIKKLAWKLAWKLAESPCQK